MQHASPPPPFRPAARRLLLSGVLAALTVASVAAAAAIGAASRRAFTPPPEMAGSRWGIVGDAAEAVRVWRAAGVHGRELLVLTGRWDSPTDTTYAGAAGAPPGRPDEYLSLIDARGALFAAARAGIAREIHAVMPPAAFERRRERIAVAKETVAGPGWLRQPFHGYPRTFWTPDAAPAPDEPVLLLVEPSFFGPDAPASLAGWLARRGIAFDLALVATADPEATPAQLAAAEQFAESTGAVILQVSE